MADDVEKQESTHADGSDEPVYEPLFLIKGRRGDQGPFLQGELSILVREGMLPPMAKVQDVQGGKLMSAQQAIEAIVLPPLPSGSQLDAPDDMPTPRAAHSPLPENQPTPSMPTPAIDLTVPPHARKHASPEDLPTASYVPPETGKLSEAGYRPVGGARESDTTRGVSHIHPGLAARMPHDLPTAAYVPQATGKYSESGFAPVRLPTGLHDDFEILDEEDPITQRAEPHVIAAPPRHARGRAPAPPRGRPLRGAGSSQIAPAVDDENSMEEDEALFDPADVNAWRSGGPGGVSPPVAGGPRRPKVARHARERDRKVVARHDRHHHDRHHHHRRRDAGTEKKEFSLLGFVIGGLLVLVVAGVVWMNWSSAGRGSPPEALLSAALEKHADGDDPAFTQWLVRELHPACLAALDGADSKAGATAYDPVAYQREMDRRLARQKSAPDPKWLDAYARLLLTRAEFEKARTYAQQAVMRSEEKQPDCLDTLALAHFKLGEASRAVELQTKAIDLLDAGVRSRISREDHEKRLRRYMAAP